MRLKLKCPQKKSDFSFIKGFVFIEMDFARSCNMPAPTVYFVDINPRLQSHLIKKLLALGIEGCPVQTEDIAVLFTPYHVNDCVVMHLKPVNFAKLFNNQVFKTLRYQPHPKMIFLIDEQSIEYMVSHQCGPNVTIYRSNILTEQLLKRIAEISQNISFEENGKTFQQVMQGQFMETPLHYLLNCFKNSGFTGRINTFSDRCEAGEILLKCGHIESVTFEHLTGQAALNSIIEKNSHFSVDQLIINEKIISEYYQNLASSRQLSVRDVLTDIFYFMHEYWQSNYTVAEIQQVVRQELNSLKSLANMGIYLVYEPVSQEKLHIIGEIKVEHLPEILSFYERLFDHFNDQSKIPQFNDFLKSLDEIQPFVIKFLSIDTTNNIEVTSFLG